MKLTPGQIVVALYCAIFLVAPLIWNISFGSASWSHYSFLNPGSFAIFLALTLLLIVASPIMSKQIFSVNVSGRLNFLGRASTFIENNLLKISIPLSLTLLLASWHLEDNFRYLERGVSSQLGYAVVVLALKSVIYLFILFAATTFLRNQSSIRLDQRLAIVALTGSLMFSINGIADIISASIYAMFAIFPKTTLGALFSKEDSPLISLNRLKNLAALAILLTILYFAVILGEGIKTGHGIGFIPGLVDSNLKFFIERIFDRLSPHSYSLMNFYNGFGYFELEKYKQTTSILSDALAYRWHVLTGADPTFRPEIQSVSRLNFEILSFKESPREGTSPGVFASFCFLQSLPVALVCSLVYLRAVVGLINQVFSIPNYRLSIIGGGVLLHELQFLFQSPLDFFLIFDNSTVALGFLILLALITQTTENQVRCRESSVSK